MHVRTGASSPKCVIMLKWVTLFVVFFSDVLGATSRRAPGERDRHRAPSKVAFHPYKTEQAYFDCYRQAASRIHRPRRTRGSTLGRDDGLHVKWCYSVCCSGAH